MNIIGTENFRLLQDIAFARQRLWETILSFAVNSAKANCSAPRNDNIPSFSVSKSVRSAKAAGPIIRENTILKTRLAAFAIFAEMNNAAAGPMNAFARIDRKESVRDRDTLSLRERETGVCHEMARKTCLNCAVKECSD